MIELIYIIALFSVFTFFKKRYPLIFTVPRFIIACLVVVTFSIILGYFVKLAFIIAVCMVAFALFVNRK